VGRGWVRGLLGLLWLGLDKGHPRQFFSQFRACGHEPCLVEEGSSNSRVPNAALSHLSHPPIRRSEG